MIKKDPRIDEYIANAADFAKPILKHWRSLVHKACTDAEEKMKWSFPHFDYKGQMMCSMAAFRQHCAFGFWKAALMKDTKLVDNANSGTAMGHLGRITSLQDLPSDKTILAYIREAMALTDEGKKLVKPKTEKKTLTVPSYMTAALKKNKKALEAFEKFSYSHKKEYLEWITEAKAEPTREKRLQQAIEWISEGKGRNWKYMK